MTRPLGLLAAAFLLTSIGCGPPSGESLCERYANDCNVSAEEETECKAFVAFYEATIEGNEACQDEYDDWLICVDGVEDLCDDDLVEASCDTEQERLAECVDIGDDQPQ